MSQMISITSKNQITIPASIVKALGLSKNQKLIAEKKGSSLVLTPARQLIEELAGSVEVPEEFKGRDINEIIEEAKTEYFKEKYGKSIH